MPTRYGKPILRRNEKPEWLRPTSFIGTENGTIHVWAPGRISWSLCKTDF